MTSATMSLIMGVLAIGVTICELAGWIKVETAAMWGIIIVWNIWLAANSVILQTRNQQRKG